MRKFLLATSAAALALTLSGRAFAEQEHLAGAAKTLAPSEATTAQGLMFAKPGHLASSDEAGAGAGVTAATPQAAERPADPPAPLSQPAAPPAPAAAESPANGPSAPAPVDQTASDPVTQKPADAAANPVSPTVQTSPAGNADSASIPSDQTKPNTQAATPETAPVVAVATPVMTQLQDLVEHKLRQYVPEERDRAGVLAFYKARNFAPAWIADGKPTQQAQQAENFLHGVSADGLDPADYPTPSFNDTDPAKLAADELTLSNSVATFARHASIGRVAFSRVSAAVFYNQQAPNAADVLGKISAGTDVHAALNSYNPQSPQYKALKAELAAARSGRVEPETKAPAKEAKAHGKKSRHHDQAKAERRTKGASVDTIVANMERWRWMPHDLGAAYVMVNLPDFTLKVVKDGKTVWQTKIVDGKAGQHATPLLFETMKYITVNPTWNVPPSIIRNEYLPVLAQDPGALARVGLKVTHNPDGSIRIYQPPGDHNALGRIRFNFPNRFLVYQHDTPDKYLFAKSMRAYSHGCMRVQNPDQYAEVLLGISQPDEHYTAAKIRSMYGSSERNIQLKHHIPVYLTYQTVFTDDAGKLETRADLYGLDRDTLKVLHGDKRTADTPVARNYNSSSKPVRAAAKTRDRNDDAGGNGWNYGSGWDLTRSNTAQNFPSFFDRFRPN